MADPAPRRDYQPREMRLVAEYAARTWPTGNYWTHMRLGPPLDREGGRFASPEEARIAGQAFRRWADLIAIEPDRLIVCEGKIVAAPGALSQIELYMDLVAATPELDPYAGRPVVGRLLCAVEDPATTTMALRHGYEVVVYRPAWIDDFLAVLRRREQRAPTQVVYPDGSRTAT